MDTQKMDRRVKYTKMVIRESFISLLREKTLSKITVKELCTLADINRATFYAHYEDTFDLLEQIDAETFHDITSYLLEDPGFSNPAEISPNTLERIFIYIKDNAALCSVLLENNSDNHFENQLISLVNNHFIKKLPSNSTVSEEDLNYVYTFCTVGSIGLIKKWLNSGMKKSAREMADLILRLALLGSSSF
ncbi:MAG: TetR-like C-terminal domain-containing protein [Acetivibrio sp.]